MLQSVHEIIRQAETNYLTGTTKIGQYVDWSMHDTIERIDAYLNSKHISGETDSLGREKPFFNIVTAATNIWYRATDIDRKDIRFVPKTTKSVILAFVANAILQNWMDETGYGTYLNQWGRALARYGSAVSKFVERTGDLIPSVVPWNRYVADPVQFDALPRIEKFYLTPAQLRKNTQYDQVVVDQLIEAHTTRKTLDRQQKDIMSDFVELYEVHGELDSRLLEDEPDENVEDKDIKYRQQMHVVSYVMENGSARKGAAFNDFTLYKGRESKDPYEKDDLIEEDGRTLGIGAVEALFDAQWMVNHTMKNMKDTLDLSSKLIMQTADSNYIGRNVLNAIETGDILIHADQKPLARLGNDKPDITALQNFGTLWQNIGQEITSTPDAARGVTPPSGTALGTVQITTAQGLSLFEIMTENKGLAIERHMRRHVIPHIKRKIKAMGTKEIAAMLDDAGISEIDAMYVPAEALRRYNNRTKEQILSYQPGSDLPTPFDPQAEQAGVKQDMAQLGNKRFFKPDEFDKKTWDEVFADFKWDSIRVEVTNENADKQAILQTLAVLYTQTAQTDPAKANIILARILTETGIFSPMQIGSLQATPTMPPSTTTTTVPPGTPGGGANSGLPA